MRKQRRRRVHVGAACNEQALLMVCTRVCVRVSVVGGRREETEGTTATTTMREEKKGGFQQGKRESSSVRPCRPCALSRRCRARSQQRCCSSCCTAGTPGRMILPLPTVTALHRLARQVGKGAGGA